MASATSRAIFEAYVRFLDKYIYFYVGRDGPAAALLHHPHRDYFRAHHLASSLFRPQAGTRPGDPRVYLRRQNNVHRPANPRSRVRPVRPLSVATDGKQLDRGGKIL